MQDSEIVALYLARSEDAIRETDHKYGGYLGKIIFNILRDREDAEELVNDTYMGAWRAIPPTIPDSLKHFLSRIARNLSFDRLDYKNAGKRQAILVELDEAVPDGDYGADPARVWEAREIGELLNQFLAGLNRRTCAVFVARYYYAYPIAEIAEKYALSESQVKYTLSKTRTKLRSYLAAKGVAV